MPIFDMKDYFQIRFFSKAFRTQNLGHAQFKENS